MSKLSLRDALNTSLTRTKQYIDTELAKKANSSHGTHVTYGGNGSATTVSRSDHTHSYLPLSGGTISGNIYFADVTSTTYPAKSTTLTWNGSTDGADIYYQVDASDKGRLVLNTRDDADCIIAFANAGTIKSTIDNSGNFSGKAATAGTADSAKAFNASKSVTLTGDVTGTSSSTGGWSVATTLANSGVIAGSYGDSANKTPSFGSTFSMPYITVDSKGRITAAETKTVKLPKESQLGFNGEGNATRTPGFGGSVKVLESIELSNHYIKPNYVTVNLPGLGTTSTTAARGDHNHNGTYIPMSGNTGAYSVTGNVEFASPANGTFRGVVGKCGVNDYWRVGGTSTADNAGYMEIATADDNSEPIYVRQYTGAYATLNRTATLLDASGNTSFPGSITTGNKVTMKYNSTSESLDFIFI